MILDRALQIRFGGFGRFQNVAVRWAWLASMPMAAAAGAVAGTLISPSSRRDVEFFGIPLLLFAGFAGAIIGTLALPSQRDAGTWDMLRITPYPRAGLARAVLRGALLRTLTLTVVPAFAWIACVIVAMGADATLGILIVVPMVPLVAHLGVAIGCDASVKTPNLQQALARALIGTGLWSAILWSPPLQIFGFVISIFGNYGWLLAPLVAWGIWIPAYRYIFFGMLAEYFEPDE